ncbi:Cyclin PHO80-like [Trypanosoma melophagium]|uniref:Cyclin PHO80-like n=1 Tax=Trypanosoma melophagium TaxID=715481 RepID=UPI00351AAD99|nr:Cyclin PHO80-like [Trypanosoma melophagium]
MDRTADAVRIASVDLHKLSTQCEQEVHTASGTVELTMNSSQGSRCGGRRSLLVPLRRSTTTSFVASVNTNTNNKKNNKKNHRRNNNHNAESNSTVTTANEDACLAAVSVSNTLNEWTSSCACGTADGSKQPSHCVDPAPAAQTLSEWDGDGEDNVNDDTHITASGGGVALAGNTEAEEEGGDDDELGVENVVETDGASCTTHFHNSKSTGINRNFNKDHSALDGGSNGINNHDKNNNIFCEAINGSPLNRTFNGNVSQQRGGYPPQHHNHHNQQQQQQHCYHHNHNHNHHVVATSRRSNRRRGFGAAAVEAIRNRALGGCISPQHSTLSPSLKSIKQRRHSGLSGEHEHYVDFQVPLPRSKSGRWNNQDNATPCETAEVMTTHGTEEYALGNVTTTAVGTTGEVESGSSTYRLSSIAPFYDCAIQQLIIECEMRVANVGEDVRDNGMYQQNDNEVQSQPQVSTSISTRSFDMQHPPLPTSLMVANSPSVSTPMHTFLFPQTHASVGDISPQQLQQQQQQQHGVTDKWMNAPPAVGASRSSEPRGDVCGGLFTLLSDEPVEFGSSGASGTISAMLHQLLTSIGLHVTYGEAAPMVLIGALVYMSRLALQCTSTYAGVTMSNWYRLVTTAILIATKMYVDGSRRWNACLSQAAGIPLAEMNHLELDFLFLTDFDLLVREEEVAAWAEWMEAVARRRRLHTPLRTFIFGQSYGPGCRTPPSAATTPLSSCAGEELWLGQRPLALSSNNYHAYNTNANTHTCSPVNAPATPLVLTPLASRTPVLRTAHASPANGRTMRGSQRLSASFALDTAERQQQNQQQQRHQRNMSIALSHPPPSQLQFCDTPNLFPPSPLCAPLCPRRGERLFSIVHAPQEPMTPPSLQRMSQMVNTPLTPPEQQIMSPVEFFKKSVRNGNGSTNRSSLANDTHHSVVTNHLVNNDDNFEDDIFDDVKERVKPSHRVLNIFYFAKREEDAVFSAIAREINSTQTEAEVQQKHGMSGTINHFSAAAVTRTKGAAAKHPGCAKSVGWKQLATHVREMFGATRSLVRSSPLNLLRMDDNDHEATSENGNGKIRVTGNDYSNKYLTHNDDEDNSIDGGECGDKNKGFRDDFEDDIFMRRNRMPTHSPPA